MQQFQDFDKEGFDVSKILFGVVLNSTLRFMQCNATKYICLVLNSQNQLVLRNGLVAKDLFKTM